jgi:hypothetical protein
MPTDQMSHFSSAADCAGREREGWLDSAQTDRKRRQVGANKSMNGGLLQPQHSWCTPWRSLTVALHHQLWRHVGRSACEGGEMCCGTNSPNLGGTWCAWWAVQQQALAQNQVPNNSPTPASSNSGLEEKLRLGTHTHACACMRHMHANACTQTTARAHTCTHAHTQPHLYTHSLRPTHTHTPERLVSLASSVLWRMDSPKSVALRGESSSFDRNRKLSAGRFRGGGVGCSEAVMMRVSSRKSSGRHVLM